MNKTHLVLGGHVADEHGRPKKYTAAEVATAAGLDLNACVLLDFPAQPRAEDFKGRELVRPSDAFKKGVLNAKR